MPNYKSRCTTQAMVHILDANFNAPNFTKQMYTFRIMENTIATLGFVNVSIFEFFKLNNVIKVVEHDLNVKSYQ